MRVRPGRIRPIAPDQNLAAYLGLIPAAARAAADAAARAAHWRAAFTWAADGFSLLTFLRSRLPEALKARFVSAFGSYTAAHTLTALAFAALFMLADAFAQILADRLWPLGVMKSLWTPLVGAPVRGLFLGLLIALLQTSARAAPRRWWLGVGALASMLIFLLVLIPPVTLIPAGRGDRPVAGSAAAAILPFVREGGLKADSLEVYPGSDRADVDMEGLGSVAHAAVSSAALTHPEGETFAAIGHLLGHHKNHDLWSLAVVLSLLIFGLLALLGPGAEVLARRLGRPLSARAGDSAALAAFGLIVWAVLPLENVTFNLFDQAINFRADAFALSLTHDKDGLCRWLITREARGALDPAPLESAIFESHPAAAERIRRVLAAHDHGV